MLSIVLVIVIWTCRLMPLWANIVCTVLLGIRFLFRLFMTTTKFMDYCKDKINEEEVKGYEQIHKN